MDLKLLQYIVNSEMDTEQQEYLIIQTLAKDKKVIPIIMDILAEERKVNADLILNMNLELSRADVGLDTPAVNEDDFIQKEIKKFYAKYKDSVGHCYKDYGKLEKPKPEGLI